MAWAFKAIRQAMPVKQADGTVSHFMLWAVGGERWGGVKTMKLLNSCRT